MTDRTGQHLGNYRLVHLLGQGGFAEVYLGEHLHLGTQAAIKLLHTQLASEDTDAFRTEARTIARLVHPHIVRVFDFGIEGEIPFLVMDYAPNGTVRKRHPKGIALPLPTILGYVKQVADALQYAHDEHFIHRDVKPENLLVGRRQEVLLSDFGIALIAQTSRSQNMQDVAGTASYMAPEQFQGKPRSASDQYALAVLVYEWLTGACPFSGSFSEIASQHLFVPPPPLQGRTPNIPLAVEQVVMTALAKDPKQRFGSVQAFATALEQASQMKVAEALPASWAPPPADAVSMLSESQRATERVAPLDQVATPVNTVSETAPTEAATRSPERSGGGERVPEVVEERSPEEEGLREAREAWAYKAEMERLGKAKEEQARRDVEEELRKAREGQARRAEEEKAQKASEERAQQRVSISPPLGTVLCTYCGHAGSVSSVAWSPDGRRIASAGSDKTVQVWDATDGGNVYTYQGHSSTVYAVAWSPDGRRIASAGSDETVQVWNAADGGNVYTYRRHSSIVYAVAWSPDGRRIASGSNDKTVQVWDAANGKHRFIYGDDRYGLGGSGGTVFAVAWSPDGRRIASAHGHGYVGGVHSVQVWDATYGGLVFFFKCDVFTFKGHASWVKAVAWSPDGKRIASASWDHTVQVWDATDGGNVYTHQGHHPLIGSAVAWSPDGRRIASECGSSVEVWDAADGGLAFIYRGHAGYVSSVAWSPDGRRIASGGYDKTVQVWQVP